MNGQVQSLVHGPGKKKLEKRQKSGRILHGCTSRGCEGVVGSKRPMALISPSTIPENPHIWHGATHAGLTRKTFRHVGESAKGLGCLHMSLERHWATAICHPSWLPSQTSAQVFFPRSSDSLDHKMLLVKVESINCLLP